MNKKELDAGIQRVVTYQGIQLICGFFTIIIAICLLLPTAAGLSLCILIKGIEIFEEGISRNMFIAGTCIANTLNTYVLWTLVTTKKKRILTLPKENVRNIFFAMSFVSFGLCYLALI